MATLRDEATALKQLHGEGIIPTEDYESSLQHLRAAAAVHGWTAPTSVNVHEPVYEALAAVPATSSAVQSRAATPSTAEPSTAEPSTADPCTAVQSTAGAQGVEEVADARTHALLSVLHKPKGSRVKVKTWHPNYEEHHFEEGTLHEMSVHPCDESALSFHILPCGTKFVCHLGCGGGESRERNIGKSFTALKAHLASAEHYGSFHSFQDTPIDKQAWLNFANGNKYSFRHGRTQQSKNATRNHGTKRPRDATVQVKPEDNASGQTVSRPVICAGLQEWADSLTQRPEAPRTSK